MAILSHRLTYLISKELSQKESPTIKLIDLGIVTLPEEAVELLASVECLSIQKNLLTTLPQSFGSLTKLRYLDLHGNRFSTIPAVLLQCPHLEIVDLSSNEISNLLLEYSQLWCNNVKVLSLKNNKVRSLRDLYPIITQLKALTILEIDGNEIPQDELDHVISCVPPVSTPSEDYWLSALRQYFQDYPPAVSCNSNKLNRAAKRMGFINTEETVSVPMQLSSACDLEYTTHSKSNDYFKRLSVLPEETHVTHPAHVSSENRISYEDLVLACRKLLFTFTECLQNIRKITSLCADKPIAKNMISLLNSVHLHIDNLVGVLEEAEKTSVHDRTMVDLCTDIISVFRQVISLLRKNLNAFFRSNDICFIRMFYMTLMCSYTEMFNVWTLMAPSSAKRKRNALASIQRSFSVQTHHNYKNLPTRQRSNTFQRATNLTSFTTNTQSLEPTIASQLSIGSPSSLKNATPPSNLSASSSPSDTSAILLGTSTADHKIDTPPRIIRTDSQLQTFSKRATEVQSSESANQQTVGPTDVNVDTQLYHTLRTVIGMVNVVHAQLTQAIQLSAVESSSDDQQGITPAIAAKVKDLTEKCFQSMNLSEVLNSRLDLISSADPEQYNLTAEKSTTWECINAFLKSIIAILANTKLIMKDLPILNEVRPNLASLAKITKDVTVIVDMSSYKAVSSQVQQQQASQEPAEAYNNFTSNPHTAVTPLSTPSLVIGHITNPFD